MGEPTLHFNEEGNPVLTEDNDHHNNTAAAIDQAVEQVVESSSGVDSSGEDEDSENDKDSYAKEVSEEDKASEEKQKKTPKHKKPLTGIKRASANKDSDSSDDESMNGDTDDEAKKDYHVNKALIQKSGQNKSKKRNDKSREGSGKTSPDLSNEKGTSKASNKEREEEVLEKSQNIKHTSKDLYEIARKVVRKVCGEPTGEKKNGKLICDKQHQGDTKYNKHIYTRGSVKWAKWLLIKADLIDRLIKIYVKKYHLEQATTKLKISRKFAKAIREVLDEKFEPLFGYGKIWNTTKHTDAYQCNLQRCPDPQPEFDEQLWSLYQGLDYQLTEYNKFTAEPLKDEDTRRILPPTQVGRDGEQKLDAYGTVRKTRDVLPSELKDFNELKTLVEKNKGHATNEVLQKIKNSLPVIISVLTSSTISVSKGIDQCSFLSYSDLLVHYAGLVFDHRGSMRDYIKEEVIKSVPILQSLLQEHLKSIGDKKGKKDSKKELEDKINNLTSDDSYIFLVNALTLLFGEDSYLRELNQDDNRDKNDAGIIEEARMHGLPVQWFKVGEQYIIVINEEKVLRLDNIGDGFLAYHASFTLFAIDWNKMANKKGKTTRKAMPNSKSLEFVHSVILTKRVDFTAVNIPPAVMKVIHRYIILERASSDK